MKLIKIIILVLFVVIGNSAFCENGKEHKLHFNADKKFKIVQFTDIHWETGLVGNKMTTLSMEIILDKEKPDLVVLTGDIVTLGDISKGWNEVVEPMIKRKINWVAVLGNHDSEGKVSRKEVFEITSSLKFNISGKELNTVSGVGNFSTPILSSDDRESVILYFFDSHAYSEPNMPGYYTWIKQNQILWYKNSSIQYSAQKRK